MKTSNSRNATVLSLLVGATSACSSEATTHGSGSLAVLLEPEPTILEGLAPGEEVEQIRDGWSVTFDKYILGVGHIHSYLGSDHDVEAEADSAHFIDLTQLRADGEVLWELDGLAPGRWTFGYEFVGGEHGGKRHESVNETDYARIQDENLTHLITGTLNQDSGVSCPPTSLLVEPEVEATGANDAGDKCYPNTSIRFEFAVSAEAEISNCEQDGLPGFVIADKRRTAVAITIHGDHLFFNGFPEGGEGGIIRLAQLWADSDLNLDGQLNASEYEAILLADMAQWDDRYQKGGAPLQRLETLGDLVVGQLKTQGHMDGEGECAVDGVSHDHADE